jgi:hypothetical protein
LLQEAEMVAAALRPAIRKSFCNFLRLFGVQLYGRGLAALGSLIPALFFFTDFTT